MESKERQDRLDRYWVEEHGVSLQFRLLQLDDEPSATTTALNNPHKHTLSATTSPMSTTASSNDSTTPTQSSRRNNLPARTLSGSSASTVSDTPYDCGYDLPCDFEFIDCFVRFHGLDFKLWLEHSYSHFGSYPPPSKSVCIFCDASFKCPSQSEEALRATWMARMIHISAHYQKREPLELRPDFHVIDHLRKIKKLSKEAYDHANRHSERPAHFDRNDLVPRGTKRPETERMNEQKREERENRRSQHAHNLEKEERLLRRQQRRQKT